MEFFFYALVRLLPATPALNALLAIPHSVALILAFILTCRLLQARSVTTQLIAGLAVLISATGAAGAPFLATGMDEMLPGSLFLLALLVLIPSDLETLPSPRRVVLAGLLAGAALGLKLTFSYAAVGLGLALLAIPRRRPADLLLRPALLALGGGAGAALVSGYWWLHLWQEYGNPLFPYMNHLFRAPLAPPISFVDQTFLPRSLAQAFEAPWAWALRLYWGVGESRMRDPRFSLAVIAALLLLVQPWIAARFGVEARRRWPVTFLVVWFLLCFVLWRVEFSIFRYLSLLELLTVPLIALAILPFARRFGTDLPALAGLALLAPLCAVVTVYPNVARSPPGTRPFQVDMGPVASDAMVLLLDTSPLAYLAVSQDPRVRFVATNDWFMAPDSSHPMQKLVASAIAGHTGELWGVETPAEWAGQADQTLAAYGLVREQCHQLVSNVSPNPVRMCRLRKAGV